MATNIVLTNISCFYDFPTASEIRNIETVLKPNMWFQSNSMIGYFYVTVRIAD